MALAWIVAVLGLVVATHAGFFWCCCDCTTVVQQTVRGCASALLSGVTVNVKIGGVTVGTGTTNGSGVVSISVSSASGASATVEIVGPTGYQTSTGTITLNCGTVTRSTTLLVQSGYFCTDDPCCPVGGSPPYPAVSYPSTITLNDGFGDVTLTRQGTAYDWRGSATRTAAEAYSCSTDPTGSPWPLNTDVSVPVYFKVDGALNCATLTISCNDCVDTDGSGCYQYTNINFLVAGGGFDVTAYPSTLSDTSSPCSFADYWMNQDGTAGKAFFGNYNSGTLSGCPPSLAGSATVSFKSVTGGRTYKRAPWQVYGDSVTCTWAQ